LFELCDAVLCSPGAVTSLPELSLSGVHRRGHGSTYAALVDGRVDVDRLRVALAGLDLPRGSDGQIRLTVDVTPWPRPDAECSPQRAHAHRPCRCDGVRQTIAGWPYSVVAVLESGRSSWTAPLDAVRLVPGCDATGVTAEQIRQVFERLRAAEQWAEGDPPILVVMDAGYDVIRLAFLLRDLPVRLLGRVRADRVFHAPAQPYAGTGRPGRHGPRPGSWTTRPPGSPRRRPQPACTNATAPWTRARPTPTHEQDGWRLSLAGAPPPIGANIPDTSTVADADPGARQAGDTYAICPDTLNRRSASGFVRDPSPQPTRPWTVDGGPDKPRAGKLDVPQPVEPEPRCTDDQRGCRGGLR